jgi:hypothetical protein
MVIKAAPFPVMFFLPVPVIPHPLPVPATTLLQGLLARRRMPPVPMMSVKPVRKMVTPPQALRRRRIKRGASRRLTKVDPTGAEHRVLRGGRGLRGCPSRERGNNKKCNNQDWQTACKHGQITVSMFRAASATPTKQGPAFEVSYTNKLGCVSATKPVLPPAAVGETAFAKNFPED